MKNFEKDTKLLIITNPPYTRSISNRLIPEVVEVADEVSMLYLDTLVNSLGKGDPSVRSLTEKYLVNIEKEGKFSDWGNNNVNFPVSVYHFKKNTKNYKTYLEFAESFLPEIEKQIRAKIAPLPKIQRDWIKEDTSTRAKKYFNRTVTRSEIFEFVRAMYDQGERFISCSCFNRKTSKGIVAARNSSCLASYYGPKELLKNFENDLYKELACMFSTNKRDQHARTLANLPITLPEFTEEELAYLKQFC
jgi:hypothetical protein